jgi:DNA polymerase-3 subunit alpha
VEGNIRFGLDAVKGVGYQAVEAIKNAREGSDPAHPFTSLWDFCERVDCRTVNKKAIEALIKCGAFGSTGATRRGMLEVLEDAQSRGQKVQLDAQIGQGSIFELTEETPADGAPANVFATSHPPILGEEFEQKELLAAEKEAIGLFISEHPLKPLKEVLRTRTDCPLSALAERRDKDQVTVGGIITETKRIRTRNGDYMMFASLDDLAGAVEMLVFGKALGEYESLLVPDEIVLVKGRVDHKEAGSTCVIVSEVQRFAPSAEEVERARDKARAVARQREAAAQPLDLPPVRAQDLSPKVIESLKLLCQDFPGPADVRVVVELEDGARRRLRLGDEFRVENSPTLRAELTSILPAAASPGAAVVAGPAAAAAGMAV